MLAERGSYDLMEDLLQGKKHTLRTAPAAVVCSAPAALYLPGLIGLACTPVHEIARSGTAASA